MKLAVILILSVALVACAKAKSNSGGGGGGGDDKPIDIGPATGQLHGSPFTPIAAYVKKSESSTDRNTYFWVRMTDLTLTNPCAQMLMSDRFVGFYIPQASPIGTFNMNETRGATQGAIFFSVNGGAQWIDQGTAQVLGFDVTNGADILLDIGTGSNRVYGALHAEYCP